MNKLGKATVPAGFWSVKEEKHMSKNKVSEDPFNSLINQIREGYSNGEITLVHLISFVGLSRGERDADVSQCALAKFVPNVDLGCHD